MMYYDLFSFGSVSSGCCEHLSKTLMLLRKNGFLAELFLDNPLRNLILFINNNKDLWLGQHFKIPILKYTDEQVENLDKIVNRQISVTESSFT